MIDNLTMPYIWEARFDRMEEYLQQLKKEGKDND
jgi:hypothetical protein